ncbi:hypothetical protein N1I02_004532 [Serratia marcescens]|uniref:hypothetical protein n=1 Tax=Escherichia coli TaxID=562 RepID=UPI0020033047|nr:hypothetical protein [Escherichia coli]MCK7359382.1 hypothetical protein [Enterobacter roggenkampii]MDM4037842.1 hypothetical protein [Escherichia coli]HDQ6728359.1 hypothetical protein [Escherichia coli O11:H5]
MSLKPERNKALIVKGLTREDILRQVREERLTFAKSMNDAVKATGSIGTVSDARPAGIPGISRRSRAKTLG